MTQDTRKDRRVKIVSLNVRYKSATVDEFIENHAHDVSRGGIYIKTGNPFPPGTLLKFEIRLASDQAVIAGVGRIVWKRDAGGSTGERPAGMGVKFIKIDEPSKAVIDRLVNSRVDAGKSYETTDDAVVVPDRTKTLPPGARPSSPAASSPSTPSFPRATSPRSLTPAAGMPPTPKSEGPPAVSAQVGAPFARKATMVGLGATSSVPPSAAPPTSTSPPPGSPSTAPGRAPLSTAPAVAPRPVMGHSSMFPKTDGDREALPREEHTVMRQAAELLEDALREAGGSMAEIGTNPLFSEPVASASKGTRKSVSPLTPASEWTTADTPQALAATVAAMRAEEAAKEASAREQASRTATTIVGPSVAQVRDSDTAPRKVPLEKKSSSGTMIMVVIAAGIVVTGLMFRDKIFGESAPPEPVASPAAPVVTASPSAAATTAAQPGATVPPTSTASEAPTAAATPQPSASAANRGAFVAEAGAEEASAKPSAMTGPAVPHPPKPAAKPAPMVVETASPTPAPAATESAAAAAPPAVKIAPPPPKPKPAKPSDDNPY